MPVRLLRPGLTTSERFNACDWFTQSLYVRLLTLVDDFGRYDSNLKLLKSHAFPLSDDRDVTLEAIAASCARLSASGLVEFYESDGKKCLQISKWQERVRSKSKYPDPTALASKCAQMTASAVAPTANDSKCCPPTPSPIALRPSPSPTPTPAPEARAEAAIPTFDEVKALAAMRAVPEASAKSFFDHHEGNGLWLNQFGKLINWQHKLTSWAASDRQNPKASGTNKPTGAMCQPHELKLKRLL